MSSKRRSPVQDRPVAGPALHRGVFCWFVALLLLVTPQASRAGEFGLFDLLGDAGSTSALDDLHAHLSSSIYAFPRQSGESLGWTGFEIYADGGFDLDFASESYVPPRLAEDLPLDSLTLLRVGVRKGLPGGIDLGVSWGRLLGTDLDLVTAEVQWAIIEGGALKPALALRVTGSRSSGVDEYELEQYGASLILSKGFLNVTPYAGAGIVQSDADVRIEGLGLFDPLTRSLDETTEILFAGVRINLFIPRITFAIEKGEVWQAALRVGIGF